MGFLDNLNFLATIGTFACVSFALSGMGVKLGKLSSEPHKLGYTYISESLLDKEKKDKLYEATARINKHLNAGPAWAQNKEALIEWCNKYEKSTRKWGADSQNCLLQNNVWHQLIKHNFEITDLGETTERTTESETSQASRNKCTYEILSQYADDENDINSLIGRKLCSKVSAGDSTPTTTSISTVSSSSSV